MKRLRILFSMSIVALLASVTVAAQVDTIRIKRETIIIVEDTALIPSMASFFPEVDGIPYKISFGADSIASGNCITCPKPTDKYFSRFTRTYNLIKYRITLYPFPGKLCGTYTMTKL